ncbi:thiol reductant ABC exporter subunit CydD [Sinomonas terrae]|uniref:Thiol reductant ABC exporter subunit CydD n=1 Tax=Sinomonas terrae TaxID=2908838 RepID=A0ABS9U1Q9_9MICC|nr:thiol reductant ABC exporter subunit CydD [Sinomonas terrae]MCH6470585.1 thiol reductant ABC exporter subunit CydD [Sinomonas terrae]
MRPSIPNGSATKAAVTLLSVLAVVKAGALILIAQGVASGLAGAFAGHTDWRGAALTAAAGVLLRALAEWGSLQAGRWAAVGVREELRARLVGAALERGGSTGDGADDADRRVASSAAATAVLAVRGLDGLDSFYTAYLPALVQCAAVPLLVGLRILGADWVSALIIALTLPLVPIFMILIGKHTEDRVSVAQQALARLGSHLVELAQGLPVLVGLGRAAEQRKALRALSEDFSNRTMGTLRVAFMSSLALELLSTISVAVVAVFIGIRLVSGEMPLEAGLLALVLAPECFQPVRDLGAAHHASEDGAEALRRAEDAIAAPAGTRLSALGGVAVDEDEPSPPGPVELCIDRLTVRYDGRTRAAVDGLSFTAPAGEATLLAGPSGAGKTTVLLALAGLVRDGAGATLTGRVSGADPRRVAYVPQHPQFTEPTVAAELELAADGLPAEGVGAAVCRALETVLCADLAQANPAELSPGQQRRIAVARGLLRVDAGATLLLLDEPTAHLDARSASAVEAAIAGLSGRATVVLVAHDPQTAALARTRIELVPTEPTENLNAASASSRFAVADRAADAAPARRGEATASQDGRWLVGLWRLIRPDLTRYAVAALSGVGAAAAAAALAGLSGWLIVRAAEQPPILYLLAAMVGVRFFGIARAVLRYAERLATHSAVFSTLTRLRDRLWKALTSQGLSARRLLVPGAALESLVADAESVRDELPRILQPIATAVLLAAGALIPVGILLPAQLPVLALAAVVSVVAAPLAAAWADRRAARAVQRGTARLLEAIGQALAAAPDLAANRLAQPVLARLRAEDQRLTALERRGVAAEGLGRAIVILATGLAAAATLATPATAGTAASTAAAVVLLQLALADPLAAASSAVQRIPALGSALARVGVDSDDEATPRQDGGSAAGTGTGTDAGAAALRATGPGLSIDRLSAGWPGQPDVFVDLSARAAPGEWLVVAGPSGSGKTTLLAVLLGFLPQRTGSVQSSGRIAWCPQESHLFDSTVRGNLAIARDRTEVPSEAQLWEALDRVGLGDHVRALPDGLDSRIGSRGSQLSGGQRQRLAVARTLVADAAVVLLDEPTAHLDPASAQELVSVLHTALADRSVVMVTHRASELRDGDLLVRLDALDDGVRRLALAG